MSILNKIKSKAASAQSLVQSPMKAALAQPVMAPEAPAPAAAPASSAGFQLPDLDPNDPDYAEKLRVHNAWMALDKQFTDANPGFDYQAHYNEIAKEMAKAPEARHKNPLSLLAIALGTQNPRDPYAPNLGLAIENQTAQGQQAMEQSAFEKTMALKQAAMEGHIKDLLAQGEFHKAIKMADLKAQNDITMQGLQHKQKMAENAALIGGRSDVARINAQAAMDRAERRIAEAKKGTDDLKLSPADKSAMAQEYMTAREAFRMATAVDPNTLQRPDQSVIDEAAGQLRAELNRIHHDYEARQVGTVRERVGAAAEKSRAAADSSVATGRHSGAAWNAAGQ